MPGIPVTEPLNVDRWSEDEQRAVYDELVKLLGIEPGFPPLHDLTDEDLSHLFKEVAIEMRGRPTAVNRTQVRTEFLDDVVYTEEEVE